MKKNLSQQIVDTLSTSYNNKNIKINIKKVEAPELYSIVQQSKPLLLTTPIPNIKLEAQCRSRMQLELGKQTGVGKEGLLMGYEKVNEVERLQYLKNGEDQDIGSIQESEQCLCIGVGIVRENQVTYIKKMAGQIRLCIENQKHNTYRKNFESRSKLQAILRQYYKLLRMFLILEPSKKLLHSVCFFPNVSFYLKEIKINPYKFLAHQLFDQLTKSQIPQNTYGYLSQDAKGRFILIDRQDPSNSQTSFFIGIWMYVDQRPTERMSEEMKRLVWTAVAQYLMNPGIKRTSTLKKNTGILLMIEKNQKKPISYLFDIDNLNTKYEWCSKLFSQPVEEIASSIDFNKNNQIIEEDQKQSQTISLSNHTPPEQNIEIRRIQPKILFEKDLKEHSDERSQRSHSILPTYDDKDLQIQLLKKQLEFYKNQCEQLKKIIYSPFQSFPLRHPNFFQQRPNYAQDQNYQQYQGFYNQFQTNQFKGNEERIRQPNQKQNYQNYEDSQNLNQSIQMKAPSPIYISNQNQGIFSKNVPEVQASIKKNEQNQQNKIRQQNKIKQQNRINQQNSKIFLKKNYSLEQKYQMQIQEEAQHQDIRHNSSKQIISDYKNMSFGQENQTQQRQADFSYNFYTQEKNSEYQLKSQIERSPQFRISQESIKTKDIQTNNLLDSFSEDDNDFHFQVARELIKQSSEKKEKQKQTIKNIKQKKEKQGKSDSDSSDEDVKKLHYKYAQKSNKV